MPRFYVNRKYERTAAVRKANLRRRRTVNQRLMEQGINFVVRDGVYEAAVIPGNIRKLVTVLEYEVWD